MCQCVCLWISQFFFGYFSFYLLQSIMVCLFLYFFVLIMIKIISVTFLDSYLFSNERERERARRNIDLSGWADGEDLRGVGGAETIIRIYCMKKTNFQFKKQFLT